MRSFTKERFDRARQPAPPRAVGVKGSLGLRKAVVKRCRHQKWGITTYHTVAMQIADRLQAAAQAAGLGLTQAELQALLPAYRRYLALVLTLREALDVGEGEE